MNFFQKLFCGNVEEKFKKEYTKITNTIETLHHMYGTEKGKLTNLQVRIATYLHSKHKLDEKFELSANKLNISESAFRNLIKDLESNKIIEVIEKTVKKNMVNKKTIWAYTLKLKELENKVVLATEKEKKELEEIVEKVEKKMDERYEEVFGDKEEKTTK